MPHTYTIVYTTNKHAYVRITSEGDMQLSIPKRLKHSTHIRDELLQRGEFLLQKKTNHAPLLAPPQHGYIHLWGEEMAQDTIKNPVEKFLHDAMEAYVYPQIAAYARMFHVTVPLLRIKRARSKWGSCSVRRNVIMLNQHLIHFPKKYTDYVIVHECCHLLHQNHGPHFRSLVAKHYPAYKEVRQELRKIRIV